MMRRAPGDWHSGRALRSHRRGHWFEPSIAHRTKGPGSLTRGLRRPPAPVAAAAHHGGVPQLDRADRLTAILERDGPTCVWCGRPFGTLIRPTTEHVVPRVKGGPSRLENEVAACGRCNAGRGHRSPVEWLEECRRRGWCPDEPRLVRALTGLTAAIARDGGQRRARPYLDAQLRRLRSGSGGSAASRARARGRSSAPGGG